MPRKKSHRDSGTPGGSQRQLRVGELVRHALADLLMRGEIGHSINLKFAPDLRFRVDDRFAEVERIEKLLRSPQVQRDLNKDESGDE